MKSVCDMWWRSLVFLILIVLVIVLPIRAHPTPTEKQNELQQPITVTSMSKRTTGHQQENTF